MPEALPGSDNFPVSFVIASNGQPGTHSRAGQGNLPQSNAGTRVFNLATSTPRRSATAKIVFDHDKVSTMAFDMQKVGADLSASRRNFVNVLTWTA